MSNWHKSQLSWALGLGILTSFYGIVGLIVYYVPDSAFGGSSAMQYKIITIALVLLTLPIALIIGYVASRRAKKKEAAKQAEAEKAEKGEKVETGAPKLETPKGDYSDISQSAEETVQFLRGSNLGNSKEAIYQLPWYLIIGTPKSGKSSLSLASNLNFQTLPSQRQSEQKFIRPTQKIDWRVSSDAVFLDTAGRYQTEGVEPDEWSGILETLRKHRGNRPLDGMILAISAERILQSDEKEIEEIAKVLRVRIDETIQRLKVRFPIYLVFTHADSIEGFRDSFSTSQKEGENLVWGATIPLEKSENAHALFDEEFNLLQNSIMKRRLMRLSAPFPPIRQLKIFNFPLHFGAARKKLGHFVSTLFRPNPFSQNPFLRGYYFTAVPINRPKTNGAQTMTNIGNTIGNTYFTRKLFRDVILRDKDLVATFQSQKVRPPILGWLLTFLGAMLALILLALAGNSLYLNKKFVENASKTGDAVLTRMRGDKVTNPLAKDADQTTIEINQIDELQKYLEDLDDYDRNGAPLLMRFGLYSGNRLYREKLLPIYYNAVEQRYKKPVVKKIEEELRKFAASNPVANAGNLTPPEEENLNKHYNLLKAYLMLTKQYQDKSEGKHLSETLLEYWKSESKVPEGKREVAVRHLTFYFKQADRYPDSPTNPTPLNDLSQFPRFDLEIAATQNLVEDVRKKLKPFPLRARTLNRIVTEINKEVKSVSATTILGAEDQGVLTGTHEVPGAYTIEGYHKHFKKAYEEAKDKLKEVDWVMGEKEGKVDPTAANTNDNDLKWIEDTYLQRYADQWKAFVQDLKVPSYNKDKDTAVKAFREFSKVASPLRVVLNEISRQTNLSAEPEPQGFFEWVSSFFRKKNTGAKKDLTVVEQTFQPVFDFADKEDKTSKQTPIGVYGGEMEIIANELENNDLTALTLDWAKPKTERKEAKKLKDTRENLPGKLKSLEDKSNAVGLAVAALLKRPLENLDELFGAGTLSQLEKDWAAIVLPKAQAAEKGYPFDTGAEEANLGLVKEYLNPTDGIFTKFYKERLKDYFEESNNQLKLKPNSPIQFTPAFVEYLNKAFRLQKALYGKAGAFTYTFELQEMDKIKKDGLVSVIIDGQEISKDTGSGNFKFPSPTNDTGASMMYSSTTVPIAPVAKPSPTPAASPSANSNSGNVTPSSSPSPAPPSKPLPSGNTPNSLVESGVWGLFKFFDKGKPEKQGKGYLLTYTINGKTIKAIVSSTSEEDLFDRTIFSLRAPQTIK
jgi:type VI secretion system protein ImpL